jgi:hypothetical protein
MEAALRTNGGGKSVPMEAALRTNGGGKSVPMEAAKIYNSQITYFGQVATTVDPSLLTGNDH